MEKQAIQKALEELKTTKRKFTQRYDLIIVLKDINIKANPVELFLTLKNSHGKESKTCAFVGHELEEQAKNCDLAIGQEDFAKYKDDKKKIKSLAREYDWFISQANLMGQVATIFGRYLGPKGKMPNPKAGLVVPPNADLKVLQNKLQKTIKVIAKNQPVIQAPVGNEQMSDDEIIDNVETVHSALTKQLPSGTNNIKNIILKKTMSKPVKIL